MPKKISGAKILINSLLKEGVDIIFGIPGGAVLPIYDELYKNRDKIKHILFRHEQGACHAADGYARVKNKVGVCIATSGPGATNLITGISTAMMDSVPIVTITGNVPYNLIGSDAFQETDIIGATFPIVKHSYFVTDPRDIARVVKEAFYIAKTGRPGPVHIDITKDAQIKEVSKKYQNPPLNVKSLIPGYVPEPVIAGKSDIKAAVNLILKSKRPVIIAGHGVLISHSYNHLLEFVKLTNIPVVNTLLGLGGIAQNSPYWLGMLGMHGHASANLAVSNADLIIGVGVRFDDRITGNLEEFQKGTKFIHFDIDPAEFGKNIKSSVSVGGDLNRTLPMINKYIKESNLKIGKFLLWWKQINLWNDKYKFKEIDKSDLRLNRSKLYRKPHTDSVKKPISKRRLTTREVVSLISYITKGRAVLATGVGQHQMICAQYYRGNYKGGLISSGGAGTMGYGLPAAIGARFGIPKSRDVWVIDGDGCFQMTMQELAVVSANNLNIKIAIINDGFLGMVKQWQDIFYGKRLSETELINPDFVKIAGAYGIRAKSVENWRQAVLAVKWANNVKGPVLIDFKVNPNCHVYPMVPSGKPLYEQILDK